MKKLFLNTECQTLCDLEIQIIRGNFCFGGYVNLEYGL